MSGKIRGKCKWFNEQKGFGFVTRDDGKGDVFIHYSGISGKGFKTLVENDVVEFEVESGEKGPKAVNLEKVV